MQCISGTLYIVTGHFPASYRSKSFSSDAVNFVTFTSPGCHSTPCLSLLFQFIIVWESDSGNSALQVPHRATCNMQHAPFRYCHMYRIRPFSYGVMCEPALAEQPDLWTEVVVAFCNWETKTETTHIFKNYSFLCDAVQSVRWLTIFRGNIPIILCSYERLFRNYWNLRNS